MLIIEAQSVSVQFQRHAHYFGVTLGIHWQARFLIHIGLNGAHEPDNLHHDHPM